MEPGIGSVRVYVGGGVSVSSILKSVVLIEKVTIGQRPMVGGRRHRLLGEGCSRQGEGHVQRPRGRACLTRLRDNKEASVAERA